MVMHRPLPLSPCLHLRFAACQDVRKMTFDNEVELRKMARSHPSAELLVRIRADDPDAVCNLGVKFGASVEQACHLLDVAMEMELNVVGVRCVCVRTHVFVGVSVHVSLQPATQPPRPLLPSPFSFHVGSGCQNASAFSHAIEMAHKVFAHGKSIGLDLSLLDIGGGFSGHKGGEKHFSEVAQTIRDALDEWFGGEEVKVIAEPGRFFAASTHTLAVCVTSKREEITEDGKKVGGGDVGGACDLQSLLLL